MNRILRILAALACAASLSSALAQSAAPRAPVVIERGWARASVQGQLSTGAFMTLTAQGDLRLVSASSPVAGVTEVHEMKMEGDVMRMRPVAGLDLPAGRPVELKPGGYHLMLLDLKAPLAVGGTVPVTLNLKDAANRDVKVEVLLPVALAAPGGAATPSAHKH